MKTVYLICSPRDGPKARGWEVDRGGDGGDETGADKRVGVNRSKLKATIYQCDLDWTAINGTGCKGLVL